MGYPTVFPTGVLVYNKEKAYNGYTIYPSAKGALLIDMNGNEVNLWAGLGGFPNKILPGGYVMGTTGERGGKYAYQDQLDLVQVDYDGNIVWKFDHLAGKTASRLPERRKYRRILLSGRRNENRQWKYHYPDP